MSVRPQATASAAAPPAAARKVRVMVVEDSVVIRGLVSRWLDQDPEIEVVAKCTDGQAAINAQKEARPNVIVLDIEMPVMDGLTALPTLLKGYPRPKVLMASTLTKRNAAASLKAMSLGAADCLPKPESNSGISTSTEFKRELVAKVRALGGLDRAHRGALAARSAERRPVTAATSSAARSTTEPDYDVVPFNRSVPKVLAIGSSTGGPQALTAVLKSVGNAFAAMPILITQHMPPTFTTMLAENLHRATGRPCREAVDGETPQPGVTYVAPGGTHMVVKRVGAGLVLKHDNRAPVNFSRPSVDVMLESVVASYGSHVLGVILTGMGADGAVGVKQIRAAGGNVIAQDEQTSVVWGMPGAAAVTGQCSAILPIEQIGPRLARLVTGGKA